MPLKSNLIFRRGFKFNAMALSSKIYNEASISNKSESSLENTSAVNKSTNKDDKLGFGKEFTKKVNKFIKIGG